MHIETAIAINRNCTEMRKLKNREYVATGADPGGRALVFLLQCIGDIHHY
jgi:hypothetical protein